MAVGQRVGDELPADTAGGTEHGEFHGPSRDEVGLRSEQENGHERTHTPRGEGACEGE
ncbi:hypothetical protein HEK616_47130 [Streptomyces nigrescens]|uniref:Uncharacterized protein n=1 Tax=Streptomyces nigrescens TaxID=1920 RepID=A0ABM7ZXX8_STRNI|nr:hypothetical protein HEK616_47130 [Streptomyces nigrescens]